MKLSNGAIAVITAASVILTGVVGTTIFLATRNPDELAMSSQFEKFKTENDGNIQEDSNAYAVYNIAKKFADNPKSGKLIAVEWQNWGEEQGKLQDPYFGKDDCPAPYKNWLFAYCKNDADINSYECVPHYCPNFKFEERLSGWAAVAKFMELYNDISIPEDSAIPTPAPNYPAHSTGFTDNWNVPKPICDILKDMLKTTQAEPKTLEGLISVHICLESLGSILDLQNKEFGKQFSGSNKTALLITQKPSTTSDISASAKMFIAKPTDYITTEEESTLDSVASTFATNYNDCNRKFDADHNGAHFLSYESENTSPKAYIYAYIEGDEQAKKERETSSRRVFNGKAYRATDEDDMTAFLRYLTERIEFGIKYLEEHPDVANALDAAIKSEAKANPTAKAITPDTATKSEDEVETPPAPATKETSTNTPIASTEPNEEEEEEYASLSDCLKLEPEEGLNESDSDTEGVY